MPIDARIPGDPASVRATADWLDRVKEAYTGADLELTSLWSDSNSYWTGEAGHAWRSAVGDIRSRADEVLGYLGDAVEVFRAYAARLERAQDDVATLRSQAGSVGLEVIGTNVLPPTTSLSYCPGPGAPSADLEAYDKYISLVASYNDLGTQIGTMIGELDEWVAEHMAPLVARVDTLQKLAGTVSALAAKGNESLATSVLDGYESFYDQTLSTWRKDHDALQSAAETFRDQLRSGNPALRAAAEAADPHGMRAGVEELAEQIGRVSRVTRVLPVAGNVIDVVSLAADVADGGSLSSGVAEIAGGVAGGAGGAAVGGAAAAALGSNPVGWVIGGTVLGGLAVGAGARWLWEAAVPLESRESIDDFFTGSPPRLEGYVPPSPRSRPYVGAN